MVSYGEYLRVRKNYRSPPDGVKVPLAPGPAGRSPSQFSHFLPSPNGAQASYKRAMPLFAALVVSALVGTPTQRVLLLQDRAQEAFEQTIVHQTLVQELLNDPQVDLQLPDVPAQATVRGAELRRVGCDELAQGRRDLQHRRLAEARLMANRAAQKLWRVASLTGEVAPWLHARTLQAAVLASQGHPIHARSLLTEIYAMDPGFDDPFLHHATLRQAITAARRTLARRSQVTLTVQASTSNAALWVDGRFVGFGLATVRVAAFTPHVALATLSGHTPRASTVSPEVNTPVHLELVPLAPALNTSFDEMVQASVLPEAFPDPNSDLFVSHNPTRVWVLRYAQGGLHLAAFDMTTGRRHDLTALALITDLADARRAARQLLVQPPAVPALERPPRS